MKKIIQYMLVLLTAALAACGGGGGSPGANPNQPTLVTTAGTDLILPAGIAQTYQISGGVPPYTVGNSDQAVAVGAVNGNVLTIGAVAPGTTSITVRDFRGTAVTTQIKVGSSLPLYTTAPLALSVGVGPAAARSFTIGGGAAPYTVQGSDSNVALVRLASKDQWTITGVAIGAVTVKIRDAAGAEVSVAATVGSPELRVSPTDLTIPVGIVGVAKISGGQPPYSVAGGVPAAVTAEIKNGDELNITGNLAAKLDLSVADATGKTVKVAVEINTATTQIRLSPSAVVISERDDQPINFTVFGASGAVCVFSSNPALLIPANTACTTDPNVLINTGTKGSRCVAQDTDVKITVVDAARSVGEALITVKNNGTACGAGGFAVVPSTLTVGEGTSNTASITGGSGSYVASSSDSA
ncbi:MAG: hypothetical protein PHI55_10345, partial [Burkholderiaceae bacterium]|nr:hypothetical protein [Burkholderiaceae bacterium]